MKRNLISITIVFIVIVMSAGCAPTELPEGSVEGNVYTCESAELTFTAPDGWYVVQPVYKPRSFFWSDGFPLDMHAFDTATGSDVALAYDNLSVHGKADCDEDAYFDLMKEKAVKINPDISFKFGDYTDVKVGSNNFKAMHVNYTDSTYLYNAYFYIRREGNFMICISAYIPKDEDIDTVMMNFS